ncbi:hypothetical protein [Tissierella praeacuta]|uniref:cache domain-containing protein n=1 Tax=Tissierella praeacuta TaxID=43131 RepID=UPI00333F2975
MGEIVGVIGINVYDNKIAEILSNMKSYEDDRYMLLDKDGIILVDSNNEYTSKSISDLGIEKLQTVLEEDNVDFNDKVGKDKYVIQSRKILGLDRTIVSFIKEKSLYGLIDTIWC